MLGLAAHDVAVVERLDGARGNTGVGQRVARRLGEELGRGAVVQPELRHSDPDHGDPAHESPPERMLALKFVSTAPPREAHRPPRSEEQRVGKETTYRGEP